MIYISIDKLEANSASTNHFLAIVKRFAEKKIPFKLVTFLPNSKRVKETYIYEYINVAIDCPIQTQFIRKIWNKLYEKIFYRKRLAKFANKLKNFDSIFIYGEYHCLDAFCQSNSQMFLEYTEHPAIHDYTFKDDNERKSFFENVVNADGIFVISTALKEYYHSIGVPKDKITIVNMIVDSSRFENIEKQKVKYPYIAYCGTASNNKDGVDRLIRSFAMITKDFPELRLLIIGKTPTRKDSTQNLQLIEDLDIIDKVIFTGLISSEEMPQILKNASVLALARPDSEQAKYGFPTKLGEYLLTKNPVVITKTGDISLFLKDCESSYLVEPGDDVAFANKLRLALSNNDEVKQVGEAGYEVAINHFNYKVEADKIIQTIIENKRS